MCLNFPHTGEKRRNSENLIPLPKTEQPRSTLELNQSKKDDPFPWRAIDPALMGAVEKFHVVFAGCCSMISYFIPIAGFSA